MTITRGPKRSALCKLLKMGLRYLARVGLMNRIHFVGDIRRHTPMCDARAAARKNTARLIHSQNLSNWV
jgi:hypothetical protein